MTERKPITFPNASQQVSARAASNLDITGITSTSAVLTCQGDSNGGDAVWSATPVGGGTAFNATTPNGYECTVIAKPLDPGKTYNVSVVVNGAAALNDSFATPAETVVVQSGIQPLRRRSF